VVLVCTGNTCRSPLAEALLRQALAARGVVDVEVSSAGTGAWEGAPASEGAYLVALELGLDLSSHRARLLTSEVIAESDLILTMARHHRARVLELGAGGQVHLLGDYAGRGGAGAGVETKRPACAGLSFAASNRQLHRLDVRRLVALRPGGDVEGNLLPVLQALEARTLDRREMREQVLAAAVRSNEAEALRIVEPLDCSSCHDRLASQN